MNRPAPDRRPTPFDLSSRSFRHTWSVDKEQGPAWPVVLMANGVGERSREAGILLEGSGGSLPLRAPPCQQESRPQTAGWHSGGIGRRQLIRLSPPLARSVPRSQPRYLTANPAKGGTGSEDPAPDRRRKSSGRLRRGNSNLLNQRLFLCVLPACGAGACLCDARRQCLGDAALQVLWSFHAGYSTYNATSPILTPVIRLIMQRPLS